MRDYSVFEQLTDEEFNAVKAAVVTFLNSDERGMFGFVPSSSLVNVSTKFVSSMIAEMAKNGMLACNGHQYVDKTTKKEEGK